jgi:hypothetical protein
MVFLLEWEEEVHFDTDPLITRYQLQFYPESLDWIQRFNIWSQSTDPVIGEQYTWSDLTVHVELEPELQTWLHKRGLDQLVSVFIEKRCLSKALLLHLTDALLQQWGLKPILRRYTLKCIQLA